MIMILIMMMIIIIILIMIIIIIIIIRMFHNGLSFPGWLRKLSIRYLQCKI